MSSAVIVSAVRSPIGSFQGSLSSVSSVDLGAAVIRSALARVELPAASVDEVIMGHVLTAGLGQNTARQAARRAGLPDEVPSFVVNKVCGSGLKAVALAAQSIHADESQVVVAGGMESMSRAPYIAQDVRTGLRMGHATLLDTMIHDGLWDAFNEYHMGITAENVAAKFELSREQQDAYALLSQQRAAAAIRANRFANEITPITVPQRRGPALEVASDEQPRTDISVEILSRLKPAFKAEGTVTAGNSSSLNDGAAAVVLMSDARAKALGLSPLARITSFASSGVDPAYMGCGPITAVRKCLKKAQWTLDSVDLIEANEAFAAQTLAVGRELGWDADKVNVNGGAIALGHPIGASGCRVLVSLVHEMRRRNVRRGLATLCIGGGQGIAMAIERDTGAQV
jgi:acetyl-CoA C-acetyltransferase